MMGAISFIYNMNLNHLTLTAEENETYSKNIAIALDNLAENELQLDEISPLYPQAPSIALPHPAAAQIGVFFGKLGQNLKEFSETATDKIDGVY
jgi:hypothetical protein